MQDLGNTFYERIQFLIKLKNVKKIKFYSDCNILKANISRWKKGSEPTISSFFKIASYFNVSPFFLMFGKTFISERATSPDKIYERIITKLEEYSDFSTDDIIFFAPIRDLCPVSNIELQTSTDKVKYLLNTWHYGIQEPKLDELQFISDKLDISLEYLQTGKIINHETNFIPKSNEKLKNHVRNLLCLSVEDQESVFKNAYSLVVAANYEEKIHQENVELDNSFISDKDPADPDSNSSWLFPDERN